MALGDLGGLAVFASFFLKRKIRKLAKELPVLLKSKHGYQECYTKTQIDSIVHFSKSYNIELLAYAYAMFCSENEFKKLGSRAQYNSLRSQITEALFKNKTKLSVTGIYLYANTDTFWESIQDSIVDSMPEFNGDSFSESDSGGDGGGD